MPFQRICPNPMQRPKVPKKAAILHVAQICKEQQCVQDRRRQVRTP